MSSYRVDFDRIPIFDLSALNSPHIQERQKLAESVRKACIEVGFFYIKV
jgi:isopenicillin N synthase-like dioxygenase